MALLDEEFFCEKCNWFTYRSNSPAPYFKPAPRCPRCGLQTRIATATDKAINSDDRFNLITRQTHEDGIKHAREMMRKFHENYPLLRDSNQIIRPVKERLNPDLRQCRECKVGLLMNSDTGLCDCCLTMFNAIAAQPGLREAHIQWEAENQKRILVKQRLMRD